jgi:hypothetical protein
MPFSCYDGRLMHDLDLGVGRGRKLVPWRKEVFRSSAPLAALGVRPLLTDPGEEVVHVDE